MIKTVDIEKIKILSRILKDNMYGEIISNILFINNITWSQFLAFPKILSQYLLSDNLALIKLFLLGESIDTTELKKLKGFGNYLNDLIEFGLLKQKDNYVSTDNYIIIYLKKSYFIVDIPYNFSNCSDRNTVTYIGQDSLLLLENHINCKNSNILDLCTGSGIQLITERESCITGVGVEINTQAALIAKVNCILNECNDSIQILNSNLYNKVNSMFDIIYANPPFLPMSPNLNFSCIGDGGIDGFNLLNRIIDGFDDYLSINGHAIIIGECLGNETTTQLEQKIKNSNLHGYLVKIIVNNKLPSSIVAQRFANTRAFQEEIISNQLAYLQELKSLYNSQGGSYYYQYILHFYRDNVSTPENLIVLNNYIKWDLNSVPKIIDNLSWSKICSYQMLLNNTSKLVSKSMYNIIKCINGKKTIGDILNEIVLTEENYDNIYTKLLNLLAFLECNGIILKEDL